MTAGRIIIVGTGVAGATAAETLRKEGYDGEVVLIGEEPGLPYRRTMASKELLAGTATAERAQLKPAQFWADNNVDLRAGVSVTGIDPAARTVTADDGETLAYDALLLATGGRSRELALAPAGVHHLRTMRDAQSLGAALAKAGSVLIIGGGLIGCEVAAAAAGPAVTILEAGGAILERVLPHEVSSMFADLHVAHGVDVQTGVALVGVELVDSENGPARFTATAADGRSWTADAVVVAVGMAPNTELAQAAGLAVADGILVDEFCATSAPGIFAAGDVARLPNPVLGGTHRVEHWNHAQAHGAAAARAMLGGLSGIAAEPYADVPWCWTNQYGKNLQIAGWPGAAQEWTVDGSVADHDFTASATREGALIGAIALGRPKEVRAARTRIAAEHDAVVSRV